MKFEIQTLTQKLPASIKKNPVLWGAGGLAGVGAILYLRGRSGVGVAPPAGDFVGGVEGEQPDDAGTGYDDSAIREKLEEIMYGRQQDREYFEELFSRLAGQIGREAQQYQNPYYQYNPYDYQMRTQPIGVEVEQAATLLMGTPTFAFAPQNYSDSQILTMGRWAALENVALSAGQMGTSVSNFGNKNDGLVMEYHPTGHVSFSTGGNKTPTPTTFASDALRTAASRESSGYTRDAVSSVTGKTGSVESQLSGMSQGEKLSALKQAGLI